MSRNRTDEELEAVYEQFMELRKMMIFKRAEKGFSWGKGI